MGQFSWITQDTNRSISSNEGSQFRVVMVDDKGNKWVEEEYEGYGEFGGKDFYTLLAEMNGRTEGSEDERRGAGIGIAFGHKPFISPSLSECGEWYDGREPENCPDQGWVDYDENGNRVEEEDEDEDY